MNEFSIGQLAAETGAKVVTIRYYEKIGLLKHPQRTPGGHRLYEAEAADRLNFIRRSRELGLSLDSIADLLRLSDIPNSACADADEIAKAQLREVRLRLRRLKSMERELSRMLAEPCGGQAKDCGILRTLSPKNEKLDVSGT